MENSITSEDIRLLIGRNLKRLRELENISQLSLACRAGLTNTFVNDIENFKRGVSEKTLAKLSSALNVEPYRFFLPDKMPDNGFSGYMSELQDRFAKMVGDFSDQYIKEKDKENTG